MGGGGDGGVEKRREGLRRRKRKGGNGLRGVWREEERMWDVSGGVGVFIERGSFMELWRGMKWIEGGEEVEE